MHTPRLPVPSNILWLIVAYNNTEIKVPIDMIVTPLSHNESWIISPEKLVEKKDNAK